MSGFFSETDIAKAQKDSPPKHWPVPTGKKPGIVIPVGTTFIAGTAAIFP